MKNKDFRNIITFLSIILFISGIVLASAFIFGKDKPSEQKNTCTNNTISKPANGDPIAKIDTTRGCIVIQLYQVDAPKTVENFIGLSEQGKYNGIPFHRAVKDFVIQGGDYENRDGTGGKSIFGDTFADELNQAAPSYVEGYTKGIVAMANSGENTNGSQFFINVTDNNSKLTEKRYTIFGKVIDGIDIAVKISEEETELTSTGEKSKPIYPVKINTITIIK